MRTCLVDLPEETSQASLIHSTQNWARMHILPLWSLEQNWPFCTEKHRKTKKSPLGDRTELSSTNQIAGKWHHSTKMRLDDVTKGYKSACFLGNCLLDRGQWGVNSSRKRTKSSLWLPGMVLLVCQALGHQTNSQTWPQNRKTLCEYSADYAVPLMVQQYNIRWEVACALEYGAE